MNAYFILYLIALLIVIEGALICFFPRRTMKMIASLKENHWKIIGAVEFMIGLVILAVNFFTRVN